MKGAVLVTDGHWNKTVAAIRALGKAGLSVCIGETSRFGAAMLSRYPQKRITYPSPLVRPDDFLAAICAIIKKNHFDVLMPMEMTTLLLLSENRHAFDADIRFPFARHDILEKAASKIRSTRAAVKAGIITPDFLTVTAATDPLTIINRLGTSLVLKPDFGEGGRGLFYCSNHHELQEALTGLPRNTAYLAQQRIPPGGAGLGVSILMSEKQKVLAAFCHRRLREFPINGGPSTSRLAICRPQAEKDAAILLRSMEFQGVAMVEFKEDPRTGQAVFLEINPRFWGSLPLAIKAGVDFPTLLFQWGMGMSFPRPEPVIGTTVRNILPGDLLYFLAKRGRVSSDFWDIHKTSDDLLSFHDPGPAFGRIISPLLALYDPQLRAVFKKRQ